VLLPVYSIYYYYLFFYLKDEGNAYIWGGEDLRKYGAYYHP
jgi:hypothetical protein